MPGLTIPEEYERGIINIKNLSDSDLDKVLEVLKSASPEVDSTENTDKLRSILPSSSEDDVEKLVEALYSLYSFRAHADVPVEEFLDDLSDAINESDNKELRTSNPDDLKVFRSRLKSLLTIQSLSTHIKARGLRTDFANIFWDAKIISDIRPIWDGDVKQPPEAVVITNTLKLEYHDIHGHGELYVCLDKEDIEMLISVLMRAQDKIATLNTLTTSKWMKIIED